jgi:peptide/nickel transport system permease protein
MTASTKTSTSGRVSFIQRFVQHRIGVLGAFIVLAAILIAVLAPILAPQRRFMYDEQLSPPSAAHPFGTTPLGRDVLSEVIWGTRVSLMFAIGVTGISLAIGIFLGAIPAFYGGWIDDVFSRGFEVFILIPRFFLILLTVALFGMNIMIAMVVVGLTAWVTNARVARAQVLSLKERTFVKASKVAGASNMRLMLKHILPNGIYPIIGNSVLNMSGAILTEAALSFLGMGDVNYASWGQVMHLALSHVRSWWLAVFPGLAIFVLSFGFNLLGDGFTYALNPRLQTRIIEEEKFDALKS